MLALTVRSRRPSPRRGVPSGKERIGHRYSNKESYLADWSPIHECHGTWSPRKWHTMQTNLESVRRGDQLIILSPEARSPPPMVTLGAAHALQNLASALGQRILTLPRSVMDRHPKKKEVREKLANATSGAVNHAHTGQMQIHTGSAEEMAEKPLWIIRERWEACMSQMEMAQTCMCFRFSKKSGGCVCKPVSASSSACLSVVKTVSSQREMSNGRGDHCCEDKRCRNGRRQAMSINSDFGLASGCSSVSSWKLGFCW